MARRAGTVLIVDDEPDILDSTAMMVEALGYDAVRVDEASGVLDAIAKRRPDLILQDLKMPGLNLAGLVAALRLDPKTSDIPVVLFSAGPDVAALAQRYGAWGHLAKPFGKQELARLLRQALGPASRRDGEDLRAQVRNVFHDQWNALAAIGTYSRLLLDQNGLDEATQAKVRAISEGVLKLEAQTERLSRYVHALVESVEPVPERPARPPKQASKRAANARPEAEA